jgi:HD-GYP domain-containing protein (c-di-GMP phosphodiesterase class II)
LSALDWPHDVVALIRGLGAPDEADPADGDATELPIEARVLGVVTAYGALVADRAGDGGTARDAITLALAELCREGGHRYDPAVAETLVGLIGAEAGAEEVAR